MRVLVTGGTGFVGSHTVAALVRAGHEVRILARAPERVPGTLAPLAVGEVDTRRGDVLDESSVAAAVSGCDAVIHAASVYSLDPRRAGEIRGLNRRGAEIVLAAAVAAGLDPIVHVSSVVALLPPPAGVIREDCPVGRPVGVYARSKASQERLAREYQSAGAPVVITYPGGAWGPHDPHDGESVVFARRFARGLVPFVPRGRFPLVDVRDVAAAHAALMQPGLGPRRFVLGGHAVSVWDAISLVTGAAGRRRLRIPIPALAAYGAAVAAERLQSRLPFRLPIERGSTWLVRVNASIDNSRATNELGVTFRPVAETIGDQVAWQQAAGRL